MGLCGTGKNAMAFICPQSAVDKLEKEKMPRKGGRWWFSWRRRDFPAEEVGGHSPRGKAGTGGAGVHEVDVLPTAQCPEGQGHSQGATGVSRCGWSWSLGRITVGDRDGGSAPPPAMVLCQSPVTSVSFLLRNAPISQMGSLRLRGASVVSQPGIGRA